jgi:hypothetical protein
MAITLTNLSETLGVTKVLSQIPGAGSLSKSTSATPQKFEFLPISEDEYPHKMVFWINALDIGKFKPSTKDINNTDSPVISTGESSSNFSKYQKVASKLSEKLTPYTKTLDSVINSFAIFSDNAPKDRENSVTNLMQDILGSVPTMNRTNTCIVLPIPNQLNVDQNIDWQNSEGGLIGNAVSLADYGLNDGAMMPAMKEILVREGIKVVTSIASSFGATGAETAIDQLTKKVTNPRPEVLFKGVLFRNFSFNWTLYASNKKQAKDIWNICQAFKFASLPELDKDSAGAFMIYPYTVDVEIHSYGKPNDWLFKTTTCAINNVSINYSENGRVTFFDLMKYDDMNGAPPVGVNLTVGFQEMEIMTKNRLLTSSTSQSPDSMEFMSTKYFGQGSGKGVF